MQTLGAAGQTKEYLDLNELTERIPFRKRAIEEFIARGVLIEGVHFRQLAGEGKASVLLVGHRPVAQRERFSLTENHPLKAVGSFPSKDGSMAR